MLSLLVRVILLLLCIQSGVSVYCTDRISYCSHRTCPSRHIMDCMRTCGICTDTDCVEGYFRTQNPYVPCRPCEEATVADKANGTFENYCSQCQTNGRHGPACSLHCSEGCVQRTCDRWTGVCESCKTGYYGERCIKCVNCDVCDDEGVCNGSCHQGWFGSFCDVMCPDNCNGCDGSTGKCYQCPEGYFGTDCTEICPTTCRSISCQQDGTCPEGCKDGFYGDKCSKPCSTHYLNERCHQTDGSCAKGCSRLDVYGHFCDYTCNDSCDSVRCQRDPSGDVLCSAECISGKMGDHCKQDCPAYCHGSCDQTSGRCLNLCSRSGYYGNDCSERCPVNCLTDNCLRVYGTCTYGCKPSFYGATCSKRCSKNCRKSGCHTDPGLTCVDGCAGGWRGNSGRCSGCVEGRYGENCDSLCMDRCPLCNQFTGTCMAPRAERQSKNIDGMYMNITKPNFVLLCLIVSVIIMILVGVIVGVIVHLIRRQPIFVKPSSEAHSLTTTHSTSHSYDVIDDSRSVTDYQTILMSIESSMTSLQLPSQGEVFDDVEERQWLKCNDHATDGSERSTSSLYLYPAQPDESL